MKNGSNHGGSGALISERGWPCTWRGRRAGGGGDGNKAHRAPAARSQRRLGREVVHARIDFDRGAVSPSTRIRAKEIIMSRRLVEYQARASRR